MVGCDTVHRFFDPDEQVLTAEQIGVLGDLVYGTERMRSGQINVLLFRRIFQKSSISVSHVSASFIR